MTSIIKPRLTLSQLAEMHFHHRPIRRGIGFNGEVEAKLFDGDGNLDQVIKQENLETRWLQFWWVTADRDDRDMEVFIANDDGWPMHRWKSIIPSNYSDDGDLQDQRALDFNALTWTYQVAFGAPASQRTFRYVGLKYQTAQSGLTGTARLNPNVIAATRLTSPLTQLTTSTLQVTYRLSWQQV